METGIHELTAGYALDALEPEERRRYEGHLAGCERCREELAAFWEVTGALAVAASGPAPRPELRERILETVRAEPQNVVPIAARRRSVMVPGLAAIAAVAAVVAIGLGVYSATLSSDLDDARATVALLSDPAARTVALSGTQGRLVVRPDGDAALVLSGLPEEPGKTYAVWVVEQGKPQAAGLFDGAPKATIVRVERPVPTGAVVAVSLENGPVDQPTTDPLVTSKPV
jgi:anti-sigma-K factor RskA